MMGNKQKINKPPYKLKLTQKAVKYWYSARKNNKKWLPIYDQTILSQARTFKKILHNKKVNFIPKQAEDFCFSYIFGYTSIKEARSKWPSLRGHESNRLKEVYEMFKKAKSGKIVTSKDHRIVQALAMWGVVKGVKIKFLYPKAVKKSWPLFWDFLNNV